MSTWRSLPVVCVLAAATASAQDFDCQAPLCTYLFPVPRGAFSDCEGVSWNGLGLATVDGANGCGFPTSGSGCLRVVANGPENVPPGSAPAALSGLAAEAYVRVPSGAVDVSFSWDFYNTEGPGAVGFNDGMLVDVIDAAGIQLAVLAFADTLSPLGACLDTSPCASAAPGIDLGVPGPESVVQAPLPAGAAFIRVAVWNGTDNQFPSHGVADDFAFTLPAPTYPGTGEDLVLLSGVAAAGAGLPVPGAFPDVKTAGTGELVLLRFQSATGVLEGQPVFIGFNLLPTGAFPPPDPLLITLGLHLRPPLTFLMPFGFFPAVLPGGTDLGFTVPVGLAGQSLLVQGGVLGPSLQNGIVFVSDAHEIQFL